MILYDVVQDARTILIDTNDALYRWSDSFFVAKFAELVDILYAANVSLFYDEHGDITKGSYRLSAPVARGTAYMLGDVVHNSDDEMFECTTAGTSGVAEPAWNLGYEATTADGAAVFTNLERNDIPFPEFTRPNLVAYLVAKAYEIDATDQNNYRLAQTYMQQFGELLR